MSLTVGPSVRSAGARSVVVGTSQQAPEHRIWTLPTPSVTLRSPVAGWSSSVARWAHNPEVAGSNPVPATKWNGPRRKLRGPFSWCGNSVEAGHARRLALQNSPAHLDLSVGRAGATGE